MLIAPGPLLGPRGQQDEPAGIARYPGRDGCHPPAYLARQRAELENAVERAANSL